MKLHTNTVQLLGGIDTKSLKPLTHHSNLIDFFNNELNDLECNEYTKAYIVSIFKKYNTAEFDYSKNSITILYSNAKQKQSFADFQNIGDYLFFMETMFPDNLKDASSDYYQTLARLSYYACYRLIQRQVKLYEEIADNYKYIIAKTKSVINF